MKIFPLSALVDVPWKNGGGVTRNIASGVVGAQVAWRISRADVATQGPFSNFTGLTRILTIVTQNTMDLQYVNGTLHAKPWEPLTFDGGLRVTSVLPDGPLTDLNLMFDPTLCTASARVLRGNQPVAAQGFTALHVLAGQPKHCDNTFKVGDTIFLDDTKDHSIKTPVTLGPDDAVLQLTIRPLDQTDAIKLCIAER